jgi:hypothetical protein
LISAEAARKAARLKLVFADGAVEASVGEGLERPRRPANAAKPEQPKLL